MHIEMKVCNPWKYSLACERASEKETKGTMSAKERGDTAHAAGQHLTRPMQRLGRRRRQGVETSSCSHCPAGAASQCPQSPIPNYSAQVFSNSYSAAFWQARCFLCKSHFTSLVIRCRCNTQLWRPSRSLWCRHLQDIGLISSNNTTVFYLLCPKLFWHSYL